MNKLKKKKEVNVVFSPIIKVCRHNYTQCVRCHNIIACHNEGGLDSFRAMCIWGRLLIALYSCTLKKIRLGKQCHYR